MNYVKFVNLLWSTFYGNLLWGKNSKQTLTLIFYSVYFLNTFNYKVHLHIFVTRTIVCKFLNINNILMQKYFAGNLLLQLNYEAIKPGPIFLK